MLTEAAKKALVALDKRFRVVSKKYPKIWIALADEKDPYRLVSHHADLIAPAFNLSSDVMCVGRFIINDRQIAVVSNCDEHVWEKYNEIGSDLMAVLIDKSVGQFTSAWEAWSLIQATINHYRILPHVIRVSSPWMECIVRLLLAKPEGFPTLCIWRIHDDEPRINKGFTRHCYSSPVLLRDACSSMIQTLLAPGAEPSAVATAAGVQTFNDYPNSNGSASTDELNDKVDHKSGLTLSELAKLTGESLGTLRKAADNAGVTRSGVGQHHRRFSNVEIYKMAWERKKSSRFDSETEERWNKVLKDRGMPTLKEPVRALKRAGE